MDYWTTLAFTPKLRATRQHANNLARRARHDPRRAHAFQELVDQADRDLVEYDRILQDSSRGETGCRAVLPPHFCSHTGPPCYELQCAAEQEANALHGAWLRRHAHKSYYTWKALGTGTPSPPVHDPDSWEVVCADHDHALLSHPLLHHPNDFLIYYPPKGTRYADKARFAYQFPDSLPGHRVVLTKQPSFLPKLLLPS